MLWGCRPACSMILSHPVSAVGRYAAEGGAVLWARREDWVRMPIGHRGTVTTYAEHTHAFACACGVCVPPVALPAATYM